MTTIPIDDPDDPRVRDYASVRDESRLRSAGLFVAEGRAVVHRLLERQDRFTVRSLLVTATALTALGLDKSVSVPDVPVYLMESQHMARVAGYPVHRGCLALAHRPAPAAWEDVARSARTLVVVDRVANPDNVGGIFRSARAFGVDAVVLTDGAAEPLYRKTVRTSMAAVLDVPFARVSSIRLILAELNRLGTDTIVLTPDGSAPALRDRLERDRRARVALVVGEEWAGVEPGVLAKLSGSARIPMAAGVDSLNASVAAAIALYELSMARRTGE
jgi:tRNA G18 (ribose-2'-O)-methylase SpoU